MDKNTKTAIIGFIIFILMLGGISKLFEKNLLLGLILVTFIVIAVIAICCYIFVKSQSEKEQQEKRAQAYAIRQKQIKEQQEKRAQAYAIRQKQIKEQQEKQASIVVQQKKKLVDVTSFENKELIKVILDNDVNITVDDFYYQILLCDKLKKHNEKYVFDDYILIFNGYYIKLCKMENLNISVTYIDIPSHRFFYKTNTDSSAKYGVERDSISIGKNGFKEYEMFISKENKEILEKHINEVKNDLYKYSSSIDTFFDLKKFDYGNFFRNETMNKIIETLLGNVHFYNEIKNDTLNLLDEATLTDYYIDLKEKYKKWEDDRKKSINQLLQQLDKYYEEKYTAENSVLYSKLINLNQEYKNKEGLIIAQVCKQHIFQIECKSKTEFDRFDFNKKVIEEIRKNTLFYYSFPEVIKEAENNYEWYKKEYDNLNKAYSVKKDNYNFEIDYKQFKFNEYKIFKKNKMIPPIYPTIEIALHYATPSLRNIYDKHKNFEWKEILALIEKSKEPSRSELKRQEMKKLQDKVKLLEEQIKQMQQGQIYSVKKEEQSKEIVLQESNSISTSLSYYRTLFENGEITREEYEQKRKELMG